MTLKRWPCLALSIVCAVGLARCASAQSNYPWCSDATTTHYFTFAGVPYNFAQGAGPHCNLAGFSPKILGSPSGLATIPSGSGSPGIPTGSSPGIPFSSDVSVQWWVATKGQTYGPLVTYSASFTGQTPWCYDNMVDFCGDDQYMLLGSTDSGTYYPAFGGAGPISFQMVSTGDNNHYGVGAGVGRSTDIDADGDTDEADEAAMRTAIQNQANGQTVDSKYDLNFVGGATDADLQILLQEARRRDGYGNRYLRGSCKIDPQGGHAPCSDYPVDYYMGDYNPADLSEVAPATPSVGAIGGCTSNEVSWTDTGDDGTTGQAVSYVLKRSTSAITTETAWSSATVVAVGTPGTSGTGELVYDGVGSCSASYYYAVRLVDDQGNQSGIGSTSTAVHTVCDPSHPCDDALVSPQTTTDEPDPAHFELARGTPTTLVGPVDFRFGIPSGLRGQKLSLDILDLTGRMIRHMEGGSTAQPNPSVHWDLRQIDGSGAPAGVYFMRANIGTSALVQRLVLVR